jgi:hypothetical protein
MNENFEMEMPKDNVLIGLLEISDILQGIKVKSV